MKQSIRYRKARITVDVDYKIRTGICQCCMQKAHTHLHHWKYEYKTKDVRKNPVLALKHTTELCYACHRIANAINLIQTKPKKFVKLKFVVG